MNSQRFIPEEWCTYLFITWHAWRTHIHKVSAVTSSKWHCIFLYFFRFNLAWHYLCGYECVCVLQLLACVEQVTLCRISIGPRRTLLMSKTRIDPVKTNTLHTKSQWQSQRQFEHCLSNVCWDLAIRCSHPSPVHIIIHGIATVSKLDTPHTLTRNWLIHGTISIQTSSIHQATRPSPIHVRYVCSTMYVMPIAYAMLCVSPHHRQYTAILHALMLPFNACPTIDVIIRCWVWRSLVWNWVSGKTRGCVPLRLVHAYNDPFILHSAKLGNERR